MSFLWNHITLWGFSAVSKLNNILSFYDFDVNFSYPSKLKTSLIENENLKNIPKFRYKKLNIFIGSNATGKTSLIKCIEKILLFLKNKEKKYILDIVNFNYSNSLIEIDLVTDNDSDYKLHRIKIYTNNILDAFDIKVSHTFLKLSSSKSSKDSYESRVKELDSKEDNYKNYLDSLYEIKIDNNLNIVFPATNENYDKIHFIKTANSLEEKIYIDILKNVLMTFDQSIINVSKSLDAINAFVIEHMDIGKIIIQDGITLALIPYLSSGTKYGINIANIIYSIKMHRSSIYLLDEQFSYVTSDIEVAMLSTMTSMLGDNEQLFYTTHNPDILALSYPFHSFYFMKKELINDKFQILISCGSQVENRNNVSPKTILDNDIFSICPNVNKIYELGENNE